MCGVCIEEIYLHELLAHGEEAVLTRFLRHEDDGSAYLHHALLDMIFPETRAAEIAAWLRESNCFEQSLVAYLLAGDRINREGRFLKALQKAGMQTRPCPEKDFLSDSAFALALDHYVPRERWLALCRSETYFDDELWHGAWQRDADWLDLSGFVLTCYINLWLQSNDHPSKAI
jgi:hypothetical protein